MMSSASSASSASYFSFCRTTHDVHIELLARLCSHYLNEESCQQYFDEFQMRSRRYLVTPRDKNLCTAKGICDALERSEYIGIGNYEKLKELTREIDVCIPRFIGEAEERIETLNSHENEDSGMDTSQVETATKQKSTSQRQKRDNKGKAKLCSEGNVQAEEHSSDSEIDQPGPSGYYTRPKRPKVTKKIVKAIQNINIKDSSVTDACSIHLYENCVVPQSDSRRLRNRPPSSEEELERLTKFLLKEYGSLHERRFGPESSLENQPLNKIFASTVITEHLGYEPTGQIIESEPIETLEEIFFKNEEAVRFVFLQGEAGYGKTMLCEKILDCWSNAKQSDSITGLTGWEKALVNFDFVFLVSMRHIQRKRISLMEMLLYDMYKTSGNSTDQVIEDVITSEKHRCLIMLDGLDEWKIPEEERQMLTYDGIPNIEKIPSCVLLFTFRPWKFDSIVKSKLITKRDKVVYLKGLSQNGIDDIIDDVLVRFYKLEKTSKEFKERRTEIKKMTADPKLKSVLEIPLLLTVSVQLWYEREPAVQSFTSFYLALIQLLIKKAKDNRRLTERLITDVKSMKMSKCEKVSILKSVSELKLYIVKDFICLLSKLGEIAYQDLVSDEAHLVFDEIELRERLGEEVLDFALKVGILSQCHAPISILRDNVSVNFFHKTVQEFLMAFHVVTSVKQEDICNELTKIDNVMELSNVLRFISGLSTQHSNTISYRITEVANKDKEIVEYRKTCDLMYRMKIMNLYNLQISCLKEMESMQELRKTKEAVDFVVSDVYLSVPNIDKDTTRLTADLLRNKHKIIFSAYLVQVPSKGDHGISDDDLSNYLRNAEFLQTLTLFKRDIDDFNECMCLKVLSLESVKLNVKAMIKLQKAIQRYKNIQKLTLVDTTCAISNEVEMLYERVPAVGQGLSGLIRLLPDCQSLSSLEIDNDSLCDTSDGTYFISVLSKLKNLKSLIYYGSNKEDSELDVSVIPSLSCITGLQRLQIWNIILKKGTLELDPCMSSLREIEVYKVIMPALGWKRFIECLQKLKQKFDIRLEGVDIDTGLMDDISTIPLFKVTSRDAESNSIVFSKLLSF